MHDMMQVSDIGSSWPYCIPLSTSFSQADQNIYLCSVDSDEMSRLIRIYTVYHPFLLFYTETPFRRSGHILIQRWKIPLQKLGDEKVNDCNCVRS